MLRVYTFTRAEWAELFQQAEAKIAADNAARREKRKKKAATKKKRQSPV